MLARPLLILGDVHLPHQGETAVSLDLARLIAAHPGHELWLNGDTFCFSADPPDRRVAESLGAVLDAHPTLTRALGDHVRRGSPTVLLAGNHDAALAQPGVREGLLRGLDLPDDAPLRVVPWFERRGAIHVEHGHLFDPDNAPTHPLAPCTPDTEPIGIALTRRFVARQGAWHFAHAHETTFLRGLQRSFHLYGSRAPRVVTEYYRTAIHLWLEAGTGAAVNRERAQGDEAVAELAEATGLSAPVLGQILVRAPAPTHHSRRRTFQRLYLDRTLAGALLLLGVGLGFGPAAVLGRLVAWPSAAYLAGSVFRRPNRYRGQLEQRLRKAAELIADVTSARLVVLGHTHDADAGPHYLNPGSFGYAEPGARGYVVVAEDGRAERRRL